MSAHNSAKKGDIAETVLLPGDPLRAKYIAEHLFTDAVCYNEVRGMLGYTGTYKGMPVSVQGTGMGVPSAAIYITELIEQYGCGRLIRIGTCGAMDPRLGLFDLVIAMSASTNSNIARVGRDGCYAPTADFSLLRAAVDAAQAKGIRHLVGNILTSDYFYSDEPDAMDPWHRLGVIAVEMETAALYTIAAKKKARALTVLTVSDLPDGPVTTPEEREKGFMAMVEVALEAALADAK